VLISYWDPVQRDERTGAVWVGSVTNYVDGLKIDVGVWSPQRFADVTAGPDPHPEFDAGHRVLIDKDGLTGGLPAGHLSRLHPATSRRNDLPDVDHRLLDRRPLRGEESAAS
jgi:hypothetical protein